MTELLATFGRVRDIPYAIPLSPSEPDRCCSGKAKSLKAWLDMRGYDSRYRVCEFRWSDIGLPPEVLAVPHADDSTHVYVEVLVDGRWTILDPTWDSGLASVLPVTEWDGRWDTPIAVPALATYDAERSARIMASGWDEDDIRANGAFYRAFNEWLIRVRDRYPS